MSKIAFVGFGEVNTPVDDPNIKRERYIERGADPSMFEIQGTWKVGKRIANRGFELK